MSNVALLSRQDRLADWGMDKVGGKPQWREKREEKPVTHQKTSDGGPAFCCIQRPRLIYTVKKKKKVKTF